MKFRKKLVVIDAFELTEEWFNGVIPNEKHIIGFITDPVNKTVTISTLEGDMKANIGDWIIKGVNGEYYPCKPDIFEKTYEKPVEKAEEVNFNFGKALLYLKTGRKVSRAGWNGKGMFIVLMPSLYLPPFNTADTARKVNDRTAKWIGEDKPLDCQPYIAMYTAQEKWQPGWLASQADMLADDWMIAE